MKKYEVIRIVGNPCIIPTDASPNLIRNLYQPTPDEIELKLNSLAKDGYSILSVYSIDSEIFTLVSKEDTNE